MAEILKSPDEVIDALGGTSATAERLGTSMQVVSNWRGATKTGRGRIPPEMYFKVMAVLRAEGITHAVDPSIFGMIQPPA